MTRYARAIRRRLTSLKRRIVRTRGGRAARDRSLVALCSLTARELARYPYDERLPRTVPQEIFSRRGFHLLKKSFFLPIPDEDDLDNAFWEATSELVGVDMNERAALELLDEVLAPYANEFAQLVPVTQTTPSSHRYLVNSSFMAVDAEVYYALVRHFQPRRIVEIGAGWSTLFAAAAVEKNREEGRGTSELTAIDPFPMPFLRAETARLADIVEKRVQDVPLDVFTSLSAGDIIFVDSTHVLRAGGDVQFEYCEILPRLRPGVLVHVHDVNLPKAYPRRYFDEYQYYFNEQYLLQSFLTYNSRFEVIWPARYMLMKHGGQVRALSGGYDEMKRLYPHVEPSSLWMRVRPDVAEREVRTS